MVFNFPEYTCTFQVPSVGLCLSLDLIINAVADFAYLSSFNPLTIAILPSVNQDDHRSHHTETTRVKQGRRRKAMFKIIVFSK